MKFGTITILALCTVIAIAACNKKNDDTNNTTPTTPSKTQKDYLVEGKWQITSIRVFVPLVGNSDLCDTMPACRKDNNATFAANGKVYSDEGATKCNSSSPQVDSSGTWSLTTDFKKLTANVSWVPTSNKTFDVLEMTATSLKLCQTFDTSFSGFPVTIKDTVYAKNIK